jgi:hypothetical protein
VVERFKRRAPGAYLVQTQLATDSSGGSLGQRRDASTFDRDAMTRPPQAELSVLDGQLADESDEAEVKGAPGGFYSRGPYDTHRELREASLSDRQAIELLQEIARAVLSDLTPFPCCAN